MLKVAQMQIWVNTSHSFMNFQCTSNCEAVILKSIIKVPCLKQNCRRHLMFLRAASIWLHAMLYCFSEKFICNRYIQLQAIKQHYYLHRNTSVILIMP